MTPGSERERFSPVIANAATHATSVPNVMSTRIATGLSIIGCAFLASCYPYPEHKPQPKTQGPTDAEIAKKKAEEEAAKRKQEAEIKARKERETTTDGTTTTGGDTTSGSTTTGGSSEPKHDPKPEPKKNEYAYASKVPGKDGFVFSPYNNKVVDVRDIPSGTLVADPTYSASEKKYFRVP